MEVLNTSFEKALLTQGFFCLPFGLLSKNVYPQS